MAQETQANLSNAVVSEMTWHGQGALKLENAAVQVVVVPEMGAKIVSLFDKRNQVEWLAGPGERVFEPAPYGAVFTDQDMSGWDEMFPTINTCQVLDPHSGQAIHLPDHGEVWAIPWNRRQTDKPTLSFSVKGRALSYKLSRKIEFTAENTLRFSYCATNQSSAPISTLWAAHPQFLTGGKAKVILPPEISQVCNVLPEDFGWGSLEERVDWPLNTLANGKAVRLDAVGPAELHQARKFYVPPEMKASWITILREPSQDWIKLSWDPNEIPYLGIWIDEGYISAESVVAPEPSTGFYDSLTLAVDKGRQMMIDPGKSVTWSLRVHFGHHQAPFLEE
jgi:galactose mutarotase-like enzyme